MAPDGRTRSPWIARRKAGTPPGTIPSLPRLGHPVAPVRCPVTLSAVSAEDSPVHRVRVGAVVDRLPGPKYRAALEFAELAPRPPLPRPTSLAREADDALELALAAPRPCVVGAKGPLVLDDALEASLTWLAEAAGAARAVAIVVPTQSDVRTGPRDRERLATYFERLRRDAGRPVVWVPGGLWEAEDAVALARELGVVCGLDPLEAMLVPAGGALAYLRVLGMGARARLGESALATIVEAASECDAERTFVAIESARSFREATRARALADESATP